MKKSYIITISIIFLIFGNAGLCAQGNELDTLKAKIDEVNAILEKASLEFDFDTIAKHYCDDVVVMPNGEPIILGKQAFIENEKKAEQAGYKIKK